MKIMENKNNKIILENNNSEYILISYKSTIAKCNNILGKDYLYLTNKWDYSITTLKQLYDFIELYTTLRLKNGNTIAYELGKTKNKKDFIKELINKDVIRLVEEINI